MVWCIHLHAREHVRLYLQNHADGKRSHEQALNGSCLSRPFYFQRSNWWSFREAGEQTGCRGGEDITLAGRRSAWVAHLLSYHRVQLQQLEGAHGKQPREARHCPLIPAHHLQFGGKHCRKEQDPTQAPVVAMGALCVGLSWAWEGDLEQRCYTLWAQQTHGISWGNGCTVVLNQAVQRTRWQIATRCREHRAIKSLCAQDRSLFF